MAYTVIEGTYHVSGYAPDGDSIRFKAKNHSHWDNFTWKDAKKKKVKKKQIRIEAVDALETHYEGFHQPQSFGFGALAVLLKLLGIKKVVYTLSLTKIRKADDKIKGFIACAGIDTFSRPISYLFDESVNLQDGTKLDADQLPIKESVNYKLADMGFVYPTYYETTDSHIRSLITQAITSARGATRGLWALDSTPKFTLWNTSTIQEDIIILPKLFRRITSFFLHRSSYDELYEFLKSNKDPVYLIDEGKNCFLHDLIDIQDRVIKFSKKPEELIFIPK